MITRALKQSSASAPTSRHIERIDSIITNPRMKIKLDLGLMRSNDETVKTLWAIQFLSPSRIFKQRGARSPQTIRRSWKETQHTRRKEGFRPIGRQRSNINVECLWFYRFILFLGRQSIKYCFNWKRADQTVVSNEG